MIEASIGFLAVFLLAALRIPLAVAMVTVGMGGLALLRGWQPALASTSQVIFETGFAYVLSVIPLFVLMGNFVARAGMARELYQAANAFVDTDRAAWRWPASLPRAASARSAAPRSQPPRP